MIYDDLHFSCKTENQIKGSGILKSRYFNKGKDEQKQIISLGWHDLINMYVETRQIKMSSSLIKNTSL